MKKLLLLIVFSIISVGLIGCTNAEVLSNGLTSNQESKTIDQLLENVSGADPLQVASSIYKSEDFKNLSAETVETLKLFLESEEFKQSTQDAKQMVADFVKSDQFQEARQNIIDYLTSEKAYEDAQKAGEVINNVVHSEEFEATKKGMTQIIKGFVKGVSE